MPARDYHGQFRAALIKDGWVVRMIRCEWIRRVLAELANFGHAQTADGVRGGIVPYGW
jgi:hypothetical protein